MYSFIYVVRVHRSPVIYPVMDLLVRIFSLEPPPTVLVHYVLHLYITGDCNDTACKMNITINFADLKLYSKRPERTDV
jgi:hypothetical protein